MPATLRLATFAFVAAAGATFAMAPAAAQPAAEPGRAAMVRHADLDLGTADGVNRLNQRIKRAATRVCGNYYPGDLRARAEVMDCRAAARSSAEGPVQLAVIAARGAQAMNRTAPTVTALLP